MTEEQRHEFLLSMQILEEDCVVDIEEDLTHPPVAISYGEKEYNTKEGVKYYPIPIATYGNFSFIQAPPKSMKTYFVSLLSAVYANSDCSYGGDLMSFRGDRQLVHFDTEQGLWHSQRVFKRVKQMNEGINLDFYHTLALRQLSCKTRVEFIEYYLSKIESQGLKNGLVIIDGVADLVNSVNNEEESKDIVQKIMTWTVKYDCHIVTVIHSNWGSEKPTGHLGSVLEKKTETQIKMSLDTLTGSAVIKCMRSRNTPFEEFSFNLKGGLPNAFNPNTHSLYEKRF